MRSIYDLSGSPDYFADVAGNSHENNISVLAAFGVAQGIGTDDDGRRLYGPGLDIRRDQMAAFLARMLDFLVQEEEIRPPSTSQ